MSIPYRVRTQISQNGDIWTDQGRYRKNTAAAMPAEGYRDYRSRIMQGSYPYARQHPTEVQRITDNGISQR